jgi:predicted DNA-binding transcriptional regulator AlpA
VKPEFAAVVEYVDDRQLAARTQIARVTWQHYRSQGRGPAFYKIGRRCLYKWHEVEAWLETFRTEPKKAS